MGARLLSFLRWLRPRERSRSPPREAREWSSCRTLRCPRPRRSSCPRLLLQHHHAFLRAQHQLNGILASLVCSAILLLPRGFLLMKATLLITH